MQRDDLNIVTVGHVDHGKSTIIGRLLADTGSLPQGKLEQVQEQCRRNSKVFEYAFLLDALKDERSQGITIDSARCFFQTAKRRYMILDAPGHLEFLKNMVTGAARAQAALLVIDASEGIQENSKRHLYLLAMLGIEQIAVLVNKMDLLNYSQEKFQDLVSLYIEFMEKLNLQATAFLPVSGREGDNIANHSGKMDWYQGGTVLEELDSFTAKKLPSNSPFRLPVQGVYKFTENQDNRRIIAGTIVSGQLTVGEEVVFYPSLKKSKVKSIEGFNIEKRTTLTAGYAAGFTLEEQIYVRRGEIACLAQELAPQTAAKIKVSLFWLGKKPLQKQAKYFLKIGTQKVGMQVEEITQVMDTSELLSDQRDYVETNEAAQCILKLDREIAFDPVEINQETGRFVIVDNHQIAGGGIIHQGLQDKENLFFSQGKVTYQERCQNLRQKGLVVWFTGISGSGKSSIAVEVERELLAQGRAVYRLDGDNIRLGLNADLKFSEADRVENIRRIAEVAALFQDAGMIVLVCCISPHNFMREFARERVGEEGFLEVYVQAELDTCISRDPKGLYQKALRGEIADFTGISSPYEEPRNPELFLPTDQLSIEESKEEVLRAIAARCF